MADLAYYSVVAVGNQKPLTQEEMRGLITAMGVAHQVAIRGERHITIGLPRDRFPTEEAARGQLEMALLVQYGEKWAKRFEVVDA